MIFAIPRSAWEFDEILFLHALEKYDPLAHHPPPPGYPLFILVAQAVRLVMPSAFATLVAISFVSSGVAFVLFALAFGNFARDRTAGIIGASLFYFSPVMLVHSTVGVSDNGALALFAAALYFLSKSSPAAFAAFAALSVGWRPQFAIVVVPLLAVSLVMFGRWRDRALAVSVFTVVCLAWLTPLALAVGGVEELIGYESSQAGYVAQHDAAQSRSGWSASRIAFRFVAHPWGPKLSSFPLLLAGALGLSLVVRRRLTGALPLLIGSALYLAFALRVMDPADGVRYAIPATLGVAFLAGLGAALAAVRLRIAPWVLPAVFAAGALVYVSPILSQRRASPSPPLQAIAHARATLPPNSVALYELPLWPHAMYFLRDRSPMRIDGGLGEFVDRPGVPLFILADGASSLPGAATFRWEPSDAYSKLTRNHYRVTSVIPVPPERRFRPLRGVYATEREIEGEEWRWLSSEAEIQLPWGPARRVTLVFGLPRNHPEASNVVNVAGEVVVVERGRRTEVSLDVLPGSPILPIAVERTYVPADVPGTTNFDRRRLGAKLYDLWTTAAAEPQQRRAAS